MFKLDTRLMAPADDDGGKGAGGNGDDAGKGGDDTGDDQAKTLLDAGKGGDDTGDDQGKAGDWAWGDNLPGEGTAPPWFKGDKFKNVAEQAKAFPDLEAKIGPAAEMLGAPEGDYELPAMPEGVAGKWDAEDPMLSTFLKVAKETGLSQTAVNKIAGPMAGLLATETAANEERVSEALAKMGTNSAARIEQVDTYLTAELGQEHRNALNDAIGADVLAYQALEQLVAKASGDAQLSSLPGKQGPSFTKADILAEQYKVFPEGHNLASQKMYDHDKEHRAKVDGMWKELFPGEDTTIVA